MEQEFAVPFPAENWGFDRVGVGEAQSKQSLANLVYRCRLNCRIAHDAALSYLFAPCFELRLYQHYDLPGLRRSAEPRKAGGDHRRQNQGSGNKRDVHDHQVNRFADLFRLSDSGHWSSPQADPWILTETEINLAVASVHCDYTGCAALQETVRKASG